jgi:hypothetical protein
MQLHESQPRIFYPIHYDGLENKGLEVFVECLNAAVRCLTC